MSATEKKYEKRHPNATAIRRWAEIEEELVSLKQTQRNLEDKFSFKIFSEPRRGMQEEVIFHASIYPDGGVRIFRCPTSSTPICKDDMAAFIDWLKSFEIY